MSDNETKVTLLQEQRRCVAFLQERETNLPSHLKQNADILSTEEHLERINAKLKKIADAEAKVKSDEAKKMADSLVMVAKLKDKMYAFQQEIASEVGSLHHTHKRTFWDANEALSRLLRGYKPTTKSKKEVA